MNLPGPHHLPLPLPFPPFPLLGLDVDLGLSVQLLPWDLPCGCHFEELKVGCWWGWLVCLERNLLFGVILASSSLESNLGLRSSGLLPSFHACPPAKWVILCCWQSYQALLTHAAAWTIGVTSDVSIDLDNRCMANSILCWALYQE